MNCESLKTRQEPAFNHWSMFITNDNSLVYHDLNHGICRNDESFQGLTPFEEATSPEPTLVSSSLFLHSIFNPDWSLGCLANVLLLSGYNLDITNSSLKQAADGSTLS